MPDWSGGECHLPAHAVAAAPVEYAAGGAGAPPGDDFSRLELPGHQLGWLSDEPATAVRAAIATILVQQVPGSVLNWIQVTDEPAALTIRVRSARDPGHLTIRRVAVAIPFTLGAQPPVGDPAVLTGFLTWAVAGLDRPGRRRDRQWFDLRISRGRAEELLQERINQVDPAGP